MWHAISSPKSHHFELAGFLAVDHVSDAAVDATCTAHRFADLNGDRRNFHVREVDVEVAVLNETATFTGLALVADQLDFVQELKPGLGVAVTVDCDAVAALSCDGGADLHCFVSSAVSRLI